MLRTHFTEFLNRRKHLKNWRKGSIFAVTALVAILFVTVPIPFVNVAHAQAAASSDAGCGLSGFSIVGCIGSILGAFTRLIGSILLFLIDIFMGFASYNGFADATPVAIGWVIVRDVVNMFFIVVLLVSAFATIIGYDSQNFRYDRVLPKLLLMAILINFSRTLIQLLVDFSQVIMLTFVNAFKDAAAGNFVTAFGLQDIMSVYAGTSASTQSGVDVLSIVMTYLLAIGVLVVMCLVMLAMIAFIIVRVVGLWMLLILSPIALFATALPERLKKGFGIFTSDYWSHLSGFLVGGPVMAFFLYLTLATLQRTTGTAAQSLATNTGLFANPSTASFTAGISAWGTSDHLASFIIALAMMLMGLKAGMSITGSLPGLGAINNLIRSLPRRAAGFGFAGASLGVRGAATVVGGGARLTGRVLRPVGRAAAGAALAIPGVRTAFRAPLARAAAARGLEERAETKKLLEPTRGMRDNPTLLARYRESLPTSGAGAQARSEIEKMLGKTDAGKALLEQGKKDESQSLKERLKGGIAAGFGAVSAKAKEKAGAAYESIGDAVGISKYRDAADGRKSEKSAAAQAYLSQVGTIKGNAGLSEEEQKKQLDAAQLTLAEKNNAADQKYNDRKNEVRAETVAAGGRLKDAALSKIKAPAEVFSRLKSAGSDYKNARASIGLNEKAASDAVRERFKPQQDHIKDQLTSKEIDRPTYTQLNTALTGQLDQELATVKERFNTERKTAGRAFMASAGGGTNTTMSAAGNINASRAGSMQTMVANRAENEAQVQADIQIRMRSSDDRKSDLATQRSAAQSENNLEQVARIDATYLTYPHLSPDQKTFEMNMGSILLDKKLQENLSEESLQRGEVQRFIASKALYEDPTTKDVRVDPQAKKALMKQLSKDVAQVTEAYLNNIEKSSV